MESGECKRNVYTVADYVGGRVVFGVPDGVLEAILADRGMGMNDAYADSDRDALRLAYADLLKWLVVGPSKVNNTSDADNGWSHAGGGYELDSSARAELKAEANAIYEELEPGSMLKGKPTFKMRHYGVCRRDVMPWEEW